MQLWKCCLEALRDCNYFTVAVVIFVRDDQHCVLAYSDHVHSVMQSETVIILRTCELEDLVCSFTRVCETR